LTGTATTGNVLTTLRQTAPIAANATSADIAAALSALDSIGSGGATVSGVQGEYYDIAFSGDKGYAKQPAITIQNGLTAKPGKTADVNFSTYALRDLVGNSTSVDLDLEIEVTDGGTRQTVILSQCSVSEELIDADSYSPVHILTPTNFGGVWAHTGNGIQTVFAITGGLSILAPAYLVHVDGVYQKSTNYSIDNVIPRTLTFSTPIPSGSEITIVSLSVA
jgi:hypothetical protein